MIELSRIPIQYKHKFDRYLGMLNVRNSRRIRVNKKREETKGMMNKAKVIQQVSGIEIEH